LAEIRDILDIRRGGTTPCRHVVRLLDQRIREVDRTLTELRQLRRSLADTRATEQDRMQDGDAVCGIIEHAR
jgi:DNA-binding transcriptional MerR regulator